MREIDHEENRVGVGSDPRRVWRNCGHGFNHAARFGELEHHDHRPKGLVSASTTQASKEDSAPEPATPGDAGVTLTIGDETWTFPTAMCAFYDAQPGQPGSRWNVSGLQGTFSNPELQVYLKWEDPDTYLHLADFASGEQWNAAKDTLSVDVNENEITASATISHSGTGDTADGAFSATCLSWVDAT